MSAGAPVKIKDADLISWNLEEICKTMQKDWKQSAKTGIHGNKNTSRKIHQNRLWALLVINGNYILIIDEQGLLYSAINEMHYYWHWSEIGRSNKIYSQNHWTTKSIC